jgi:protein KRI1
MDDDLLQVHHKSKAEIDHDEQEVKRAIVEMASAKQGELLDENEAQADKFLTEYMLNKKWIDQDDLHGNRLDTGIDEDEDGDEDEDELDKAEDFESAYNFRFEEGGVQIQSYARNIPVRSHSCMR